MDVVDLWTGRRANALRQASRCTNESFAMQLGTAVRTVARWNAEPDLVPVVELQRALDTVLERAPAEVKARFTMLVNQPGSPISRLTEANTRSLGSRAALSVPTDAGANIDAALAQLDEAAGWPPGTARERVNKTLTLFGPQQLRNRSAARARVSQAATARALAQYYRPMDAPNEAQLFQATVDGQPASTSILTERSWLDIDAPLRAGAGRLQVTTTLAPDMTPKLDDVAAQAAIRRLAEVRTADLQVAQAPIYRLTDVQATAGGLTVTFGLSNFVDYALTMDLLEQELVDAIADGQPIEHGTLPLRDRYLPDLAAVTDPSRRLCAGGVLALFAAARPGSRRRPGKPDYILLIQERSGRVVNAARRLAVIPKAFHQPLIDYSEDADPAATLEREMEEELFGREDVDTGYGHQLHGDPMHPSRLSEPMRWLYEADGDRWRMECTGFGLNLVSGNYEISSLIVIEDEEWWAKFGGQIEANWEAGGLRRFSTQDRQDLSVLASDRSWSNEGLFAYLTGLRRLAHTGESRVDLPDIEWDTVANG